MRIYLPLLPGDRSILQQLAAGPGRSPRIPLEAGRAAWAVSDGARSERPGEDLEDLEYDALQDAVFVASSTADAPRSRLAVMAGDVPERATRDASESGGAFGIELAEPTALELVSIHVSELGAARIAASDTDPALLWFDAGEIAEALAYVETPA